MNFLILLSFLFLIHKLYDTDNLIETDRSRRLRESTNASFRTINSVRSLDKFKHSRKLEFVANLLKINLLFLIIKIVAHNFETFDRKNWDSYENRRGYARDGLLLYVYACKNNYRFVETRENRFSTEIVKLFFYRWKISKFSSPKNFRRWFLFHRRKTIRDIINAIWNFLSRKKLNRKKIKFSISIFIF